MLLGKETDRGKRIIRESENYPLLSQARACVTRPTVTARLLNWVVEAS